MAELTQYQRDILARTLLGEAAGEGSTGMEAVAHVIRDGRQVNGTDMAFMPESVQRSSRWNTGY